MPKGGDDMPKTGLAPHEILELHELMRNELTCAKKLKANLAIVDEGELRSFMENSLNAKQTALHQFERVITHNTQQLQ